MADETEGTVAENGAVKTKKLDKSINYETGVITITEKVTGEKLDFDFNELPEAIQAKFGPFGLGHKLGDAAAGKEGDEAVASIKKVWAGVMNGDWSVRAPAAEKITKKGLADNLSKMDPAKAAQIREALAAVGITL